MRDVTAKIDTLRTATAKAELRASPSTLELIREGKAPKGDPLPVARVAAVQAAKNTPQIIPYCHPVPLTFVGVEFELGPNWISVTCTAKALYKTGVEMEALTGAAAAALSLYDMLKMVDDDMEIVGIRLVEKTGGKSDFALSGLGAMRACVVVISDSVHAGSAGDVSGALLRAKLQSAGLAVDGLSVCRDEAGEIAECVRRLIDETRPDVIVTTGGTGVGPRDVTPEAVRPLLDRELDGIAEALRAYGQARIPYAMLSRCLAGVRGETLIVCLPGAPSAVEDGFAAVFPHVLHAMKVMRGARHSAAPVSGAGE